MRQPTEDQNEGAVLERQPAMVQAARTAAIANNHNNKEQGKQATINKLGSALTTAITPYLEEQAKNENEARFTEAYLKPGTEAGKQQFLKDNKRTGLTAAVFGGQTPEYRGTLASSADGTANELYVEQSNFIESDQGDMPVEDYYTHSKEVAHKFVHENFRESPDAAVAFMRSWEKKSVALATQHSKLQLVRDQQKARSNFKNEFQSNLSAYKTLAPHDGEGAHVLLSDMYNYSKIKTNMAAPAWTSAVIEETIATINLGDTSTIEAFEASTLRTNLDAKQFKAYKTSISKLDTDNVNRVSNFNDELELGIMAAQTHSQVDRAFETHANNIITLSARNTLTAKHRATISGGDVFRGKLAESYDKKRKAERTENNKYLKTEAENAKAVFDYDISTMQGNEGDTITRRISRSSEHVSSSIKQANNPDLPLDIRNLYIKQATAGQTELESSGVDVETALASKANLIQSQLTLIVAEAASKGTLPIIPPELLGALNNIGSITKDDGTKTLVNNLKTNVSKASSKAGLDYIKGLNTAEVDAFQNIDNESKIGLKNVETDTSVPVDLKNGIESQYIENIIGNIQQERERNDLTKSGAEELQKQELAWKTVLKTKVDEAARLAAKKATAKKKVDDNRLQVDGVKEAIRNSTSVPTTANKKQKEQAGDELIEELIRTPDNQDVETLELFDTALTNRASILSLQYKFGKVDTTIESPKLKAAVNASLRRMTSDLPDAENVNGTKWSQENTTAVEAMQTMYAEGGVLWQQLSNEEQSKAIYLMSAVNANMDRASTLNKANSPDIDGSGTKKQDKYWKGIVDALDLGKANNILQSQASSMYDYLAPKLGHDGALEHTKKLVQNASIEENGLTILFGNSYPKIPVKTTQDGKEVVGSTDLKSMAKNFMKFTPEIKTYGVTGVKRPNINSAGSVLLQQLVGNNERKDGTAITSFSEIPGFSAEVVGDNVIFHSNYGTSELSLNKLGNLATDLENGKIRHDKRTKEQQRTFSMGTRTLFN